MDSGKDQKNEGEKQFSIQPVEGSNDPKFSAHSAQPGPVLAKEMPAPEGSKEDRLEKKENLNK